jgi:hypothetical protein
MTLQQGEFVMNGPRIVATATFLLLLPQFNNFNAAGLYDGEAILQRQPASDAREAL